MTKALCLIAAVFTLTAGAQENTKPALQPMEQGPYQPTWESLAQYEAPEWFRDAKFGIWAHWGPQCEPEAGDWYARHMYSPGTGNTNSMSRNTATPPSSDSRM